MSTIGTGMSTIGTGIRGRIHETYETSHIFLVANDVNFIRLHRQPRPDAQNLQKPIRLQLTILFRDVFYNAAPDWLRLTLRRFVSIVLPAPDWQRANGRYFVITVQMIPRDTAKASKVTHFWTVYTTAAHKIVCQQVVASTI